MAIVLLTTEAGADDATSHGPGADEEAHIGDTSGANLIVAGATGADPLVCTDETFGNTMTGLTRQLTDDGNLVSRLFYKLAPTVGASHVLSVPWTGGGDDCDAAAFSGVGTFYQESGAISAANTDTTIQPGSLTAPENGCLFVAAMAWFSGVTTTASVNSGFTILGFAGGQYGTPQTLLAYKIQGTAAAENPTFTYTNDFNLKAAATMAVFRPAAAGQIPRSNRMQQYLVR